MANLPKNSELRERLDRSPEGKLDPSFIFGEIAAGIDLGQADKSKLTPGEQWKVWLDEGIKTDLDLIMELSRAPGKPKPGQRIADQPVPYYSPGPVQLSAHKAAEKVLLVSGGTRAGKDLALDTPVLTRGKSDWDRVWKTQGTLEVGDIVFAPSGSGVRVAALGPIEIRPTIELTFSDGSKIQAGKEHEWPVDGRIIETLEILETFKNVEINIQSQKRFVTVVDAEYVDSTPLRCIEVDSSDGLYMVGPTLIATHNSKYLAAQLFPYMFKSYSYIWVVANDYKLAREEFNYIEMWLKWLQVPLQKPPGKPKEGGWQLITKWGSMMETMTGRDDSKIEMANLNACGIAEAGQTSRDLLDRVRGRVMQKRGRIFMSGTMMEAQAWYVNALKQYKNGDDHGGWRSFSMPSFDNLAVYPLGENDPEIQLLKIELPEDEYARRVLALPTTPTGLVFGTFDPDVHVVPMRFVEVNDNTFKLAMEAAFSPFADELRGLAISPRSIKEGITVKGWEIPETATVEIAVDPGYSPGRYGVAACVRTKDGEVLVFDEVYEAEKLGEEVIQICQNKPWWPQVKRGTIDIAGGQHQMNISEVEKWQKATGLRLRSQFVPILDGISRFREFLRDPQSGMPRIYVDPRCDNLIWELTQYRYPKLRDESNMRLLPVDRANHLLKAITYYLVINFGFSNRTGGTTSRKYVDKKPARQRSGHGWMFDD